MRLFYGEIKFVWIEQLYNTTVCSGTLILTDLLLVYVCCVKSVEQHGYLFSTTTMICSNTHLHDSVVGTFIDVN